MCGQIYCVADARCIYNVLSVCTMLHSIPTMTIPKGFARFWCLELTWDLRKGVCYQGICSFYHHVLIFDQTLNNFLGDLILTSVEVMLCLILKGLLLILKMNLLLQMVLFYLS